MKRRDNHPKPLTRELALAVNDNLYRLAQATHPQPLDPLEQFSYDGVGNRVLSHLSSTHVVDDANRLLEDDAFTYTYDLNGNLTSKTDKVTTDTTTYTWTVENKLRSVQKPDGEVVIFRYDGLGRRIEKRTEQGGFITSLTRYIYDGEDILFETDADGNITKRYIHGPGIDEPLAVEIDSDVDGTFDESAYYHTDGLGSVTVLTDGVGTPVKTYRYDAFGNMLEETGTLEQAYSYTGREGDSETGLYYYRTRYYDAQMGRFLAEDPIGLAGGINFYGYVSNNPVRFVDPWGLKMVPRWEYAGFSSAAECVDAILEGNQRAFFSDVLIGTAITLGDAFIEGVGGAVIYEVGRQRIINTNIASGSMAGLSSAARLAGLAGGARLMATGRGLMHGFLRGFSWSIASAFVEKNFNVYQEIFAIRFCTEEICVKDEDE